MTARDTDQLMTEMEAMAKIAEILGELPHGAARQRVMQWVADYFSVGRVPTADRVTRAAGASIPNEAVSTTGEFVIESFEELAEAAAQRAGLISIEAAA